MRILIIVLCILCTQSLSAQSGLPDLSPRAVIKQPVGYTAITLEYGRPAMRGRTIFGEVVPYDKLWRTGASKGTSVTFEHPVTIAKKKYPGRHICFCHYSWQK